MFHPQQVEELICLASAMDRAALINQFQHYKGRFPVDFTPEFLRNESLDRLRHIFVALCLQNQHIPELASTAA